MLSPSKVLQEADRIYIRLKAEKGILVRAVQSDQIRALCEAMVSETNKEITALINRISAK
jgi:hypothetical protein